MPPTHVEVLACGAPDRGDDGAAVIAVGRLADALPSDVRTRIVGQLDIDDLLAVPKGAGVVVADTALGVDPGWIVEIPFSGLAGREAGIRPRSSHALSIPETIAVASIIRGHPLPGHRRRDRRRRLRSGRGARAGRSHPQWTRSCWPSPMPSAASGHSPSHLPGTDLPRPARAERPTVTGRTPRPARCTDEQAWAMSTGALQPTVRFPGIPVHRRRVRGHRPRRDASVGGRCAYPITPSTTMAAVFQAAVADGRTEPVGDPAALLRAGIRALARRRRPRASRSPAAGSPTSPPARAWC